MIEEHNKHYHYIDTDLRHIYSVDYNPRNGMYFIHNIKTGVRWELLPPAPMFPKYVEKAMTEIKEYHLNQRGTP